MADLKKVEHWADALIKLYLDERAWSFRFDHARTRAGLCDFTNKRISVSKYLAAKYEDDEIHQVLLHEIAHAMAGPRAGHGPKWKETARELGYDGKRTHDGSAANELAPWVGTCPGGHEHYRFRKPTRTLSCGACGKGFSRAHLITWVHRDVL
jgi:predicted SprT family Zn-dependent metalloprotease